MTSGYRHSYEQDAANAGSHNRFHLPWWTSPAWLTACLLAPVAFAIQWYRPKYIDVGGIYYHGFMVVLCMLGLVAFVLGASIAALAAPRAATRPAYAIEWRYMDFLAGVSVAAYLLWFGGLIIRPEIMIKVLSGTTGGVRDEIGTIPGVTTLAQVAVCYSALYGLNFSISSQIPRRHHVLFAGLLLLATIRMLVWSERLALIEYALPPLLFFLGCTYARAGTIARVLICVAPFILILLSFALFAAGEYFRSWQFYSRFGMSFLPFIFDRWVAYYFISLNNGAFLVSAFGSQIPDLRLIHLLNWFYQLPILGPWLTDQFGIDYPEAYALGYYLNPEFNVFTAVFPTFYDLGIPGGLVFWGAAGFFVGTMHCDFKTRRGLGLIVFPTLFIAMTEMLRIDYVFATRYVYVFAGCLVAYFYYRRPLMAGEAGQRLETDRIGSQQQPRPRDLAGAVATGASQSRGLLARH